MLNRKHHEKIRWNLIITIPLGCCRNYFFLKKRWGGEEAKTRKEYGLHSSLLLFFLLAITFLPLISGMNFIPFERYPYWSLILARSSGQPFQVESPAYKRLIAMPWAEDAEVGSVGITWPENLYFASKLKRGQFPLWDPYTGGGVPTLDNGQCRPFNPFRLPFYLFPTSWMYSLTLLLGLVFGGLGAYLWLSRRGLSPAALTLGTGLFVLNPWVLDRLVLTDSNAYFLLPWCLLTFEKMVWRFWPSITRTVLCLVLMGHCGHPVLCMIMSGMAAAVYLLGEGSTRKVGQRFSEKCKATGVVAALTAACLTILWLPLLRLLAEGDIYKKHAWFVGEYSWKSLITLPADMFVPPAVGLILVCALLSWEKLPKVWVGFLAAVFVLLFPLPWVGTLLPNLLSFLGLPSFYLKGVFWASLSFMVPYGLDGYRASQKGVSIAAFAIGTIMLAIAVWQFVIHPMPRNDISAFPTTAFLFLALGLLVLVVFRANYWIPSLLVSTVVLAPLAFPLSFNKLLWNTIDCQTNSVVEWLKTNRPHARSVSVDPRLSLAIPPNLGQAYGVRCVEVNAAIFLNNYWSMFHHPRALPTTVFFDFYSPNVFTQMGASVVLLPNNISPSGLDLLTKGIQFSAYSILGAHGRLYFAERTCHFKPGTTFVSQIRSLSHHTDAVAVVETMGNPVPAVIPEIPCGESKAVFERDETEDIVVRTECPSEGLLVLRDSWYPGWMAFVDGKKVPILRINGCFRGVMVPVGGHMVRFVYRPTLVYTAGLLSLLATLFIMVVSVLPVVSFTSLSS